MWILGLKGLKKLSKQKIQKWTQCRGQKILLNWIARYSNLQVQSNQTVFLSEWDLFHSTKPNQSTADTHGL